MRIIFILIIFISANLFALDMKIKSKQYNNTTVVKALIGNKVEFHKLVKLQKENHITNIKIKADDKLVLNMMLSKNISAKPMLKFKYKNIDANSLHVELKRVDSNIEKYTKKIQKVDRNIVLKPYLKLKNNPKKYKAKLKIIQKLYGDIILTEDGIEIIAPDRASWGGSIPVAVRSIIQAKSLTLFVQVEDVYDIRSNSINKTMEFVCKWLETPYSIVDNYIKIQMKHSGDIIVILEANDGKFYTAMKHIKVELAGEN